MFKYFDNIQLILSKFHHKIFTGNMPLLSASVNRWFSMDKIIVFNVFLFVLKASAR